VLACTEKEGGHDGPDAWQRPELLAAVGADVAEENPARLPVLHAPVDSTGGKGPQGLKLLLAGSGFIDMRRDNV